MAILRMEDGREEHALDGIREALAPLGIEIAHWPTGDDPRVKELLSRRALDANEKDEVLVGLDHYFRTLEHESGYRSRDLIVLHPEVENLDAICAKFASCHTHDDDEVRYIVAGEGIFGFVRPDGSQVTLTVQPGEYINVPRDTEHWFVLTPAKQIKAVRYFTGKDGWVPRYTGTESRL